MWESRLHEIQEKSQGSKMHEHEEASRAQKGQTQDTVEARQADQFGQNIKQEVQRKIRL